MRDEVGWEGGGGGQGEVDQFVPSLASGGARYSVVQTGLTLLLSANQSAVCRFKIRNR